MKAGRISWFSTAAGSASLLVVAAAGVAYSQTVPALRPASGLSAAGAPATFERAGPRHPGPLLEAAGVRAPAAPGSNPDARAAAADPRTAIEQPAARFQRVCLPFRFADEEIAIPEVQEVIFFTETRPVWIRIHLKITGSTLRAEWKSRIRKLFEFFDRDGDGYLSPYETELIFTNHGVTQLISQGSTRPGFMEPERSFAGFDRDGDGKISFDEFLAYYNPSAQSLIVTRPGGFNNDALAPVVTEELFKLLDRNKDGKLSKEELQGAETLLSSLDLDEDECLSALEMVPDLFSRGNAQPATTNLPLVQVGKPAGVPAEPLQVYPYGGIPDTILEQLLTRYDKDKNLRLSKAEIGLDPATFTRLDRNGDGELAVTELLAWRDGPPDLDVETVIGVHGSPGSVNVLPGPDGRAPALAGAFKISQGGRARLQIGNQQLELDAFALPFLPPAPRAPAAAGLAFEDGGKGYITEKELVGPQRQYMRILFDVIDRNGDGKMTRAEFDAYVQLQQSFQSLPLTLNYASQVPSLFQLLDTDGDGRLSIRELRNAWSHMRDLEPGGGDFITRAAIQAHGTVRLGQLTQANAAASQAFMAYTPRIVAPTRGPLWFRKMDRNADGEVSRSEFLGRFEDFARIDTDGDGRISLQEAEAATKVLPPGPGAREAVSELDRLQGNWVVTSAEVAGKAFKTAVGEVITFTGEQYSITGPQRDAVETGTFQVDISALPKHIDFRLDAGKRTLKGVYKLDGDNLSICIDMAPGMERPTQLASDPKSEHWKLLVLKRQGK